MKNKLVSKYQRLLRLEEQALEQKIELASEPAKAIKKANPSFKERHVVRYATSFRALRDSALFLEVLNGEVVAVVRNEEDTARIGGYGYREFWSDQSGCFMLTTSRK